MSGETFYDDPGVAQFYDLVNGWAPDFEYCAGLAKNAGAILDLGCGTGELCAALVPGRRVVGVDPSAAMLNIARARPGADGVHWVLGDGRDVRLGERFDVVCLTSHAFQCFLSDGDQDRALATIAAHLAPGGTFVFDTRNPGFPGARSPQNSIVPRVFNHPSLGEVSEDSSATYDQDRDILSYENTYTVMATGVRHQGRAAIRYRRQVDLAQAIARAGLQVDRWMGDWAGAPFRPDSYDIIPRGRLA